MNKNEIRCPIEYFDSWAYEISNAYWSLFGVTRKTWIDTEKAKPLREAKKLELINDGMDEKEAQKQVVNRIRPKRTGWGLSQTDCFDFSRLYSLDKKGDNLRIQIVENKDFYLTLLFLTKTGHCYDYVKLCKIHHDHFVDFIKTGDEKNLIKMDVMMLPETPLKYDIKAGLEKNRTDKNGQAISENVNKSLNNEKSLNELAGVLKGITADDKINNKEALFLQNWLQNHSTLKKEEEYQTLFSELENIVSDGVVTDDEKSLVLSIVKSIDDDKDYEQEIKKTINQSLGILAGIVSDNKVNEDEIDYLKDWIEKIGSARYYWPISNIYNSLVGIKSEAPTEKQSLDLLKSLESLVGGSFINDGVASGKTINLPFDEVDEIDFKSKIFCFTGTFSSMSRWDSEYMVQELGGFSSSAVRLKVDYLVVGSISSRDWAFSSYGRKIEKAIRFRDEGKSNIKIISEEDFLNIIRS